MSQDRMSPNYNTRLTRVDVDVAGGGFGCHGEDERITFVIGSHDIGQGSSRPHNISCCYCCPTEFADLKAYSRKVFKRMSKIVKNEIFHMTGPSLSLVALSRKRFAELHSRNKRNTVDEDRITLGHIFNSLIKCST